MAIDADRRTQMPAVRVEQPAAREVVLGELHAETQQAPVVFAVRLALQEGKDHVRAETFDDFHGAIDARSFRLADVGHQVRAARGLCASRIIERPPTNTSARPSCGARCCMAPR